MTRQIERRSAGALAREVGSALGAYFKGQCIVACILSVLYATGFAILGLPFWYLVGPVCGFLNFIPYFGYLAGMLLSATVALLGGLAFDRFIGVVLVFVAVGAFESYFLTPRIVGRRIGVRPLYVFLVVLVAGTGFGFIGLLLAIPLLAVAAVVYRFWHKSGGDADDRRADSQVSAPPRVRG